MDVNRPDTNRLAGTAYAAIHGSIEGIAIESDLTPCQGATQCAEHSAGDRGYDVVERRCDRRAFLGPVIFPELSLHSVNDRLGNLSKITKRLSHLRNELDLN